MDKTIWKFPIGTLPFQRRSIAIPQDCTVLHAAFQEGTFCVWALIDADSPQTRHLHLEMFVTGEAIPHPETLRHLVTIQDGLYVGHIFERLGEERAL